MSICIISNSRHISLGLLGLNIEGSSSSHTSVWQDLGEVSAKNTHPIKFVELRVELEQCRNSGHQQARIFRLRFLPFPHLLFSPDVGFKQDSTIRSSKSCTSGHFNNLCTGKSVSCLLPVVLAGFLLGRPSQVRQAKSYCGKELHVADYLRILSRVS